MIQPRSLCQQIHSCSSRIVRVHDGTKNGRAIDSRGPHAFNTGKIDSSDRDKGIMWRHQSNVVFQSAKTLGSGRHEFGCGGIDRSESYVTWFAGMGTKHFVDAMRRDSQPQACLPNGVKIRFGYIVLPQMHSVGVAFDSKPPMVIDK
jgi:hypothetical protein